MGQIIINSRKYGEHILLFDDKYLVLVSGFSWYLKPERNGNFYAHRNCWINGKRTGMSFHRTIHPEWKMIDHINGNGLDNRDSNLRESSYKENNKNKTKRKKATSPYKGVYLRKKSNKWIACICVNYERIYLGDFKTDKEAAIAYNNASIKYFGFGCILNEV